MKKESVLLSVIIPVYNIEDSISKCVNSVIQLTRTLSATEIILIDDGSTDSSGVICDKYVAQNISVIHQKNKGLSESRNIGLEKSNGKYIWFVDGDDFILNSDSVSSLIFKGIRSKCDAIIFDTIKYNETNNRFKRNPRYGLKSHLYKDNVICALLKRDILPRSVWTVVVKRSLLEKNSIRFTIGVLGEDTDWILQVFTRAHSVLADSLIGYAYRINRSGSITKNRNVDLVLDPINNISKWESWLKSNCISSEQCYLMNSYLAYIYSTLYAFTPTNKRSGAYIIVKKAMESKNYLFKYSLYRRTCFEGIFYAAFGYWATSKAVQKIASIRN